MCTVPLCCHSDGGASERWIRLFIDKCMCVCVGLCVCEWVDSQQWPPVAVCTCLPHPSWHLWPNKTELKVRDQRLNKYETSQLDSFILRNDCVHWFERMNPGLLMWNVHFLFCMVCFLWSKEFVNERIKQHVCIVPENSFSPTPAKWVDEWQPKIRNRTSALAICAACNWTTILAVRVYICRSTMTPQSSEPVPLSQKTCPPHPHLSLLCLSWQPEASQRKWAEAFLFSPAADTKWDNIWAPQNSEVHERA